MSGKLIQVKDPEADSGWLVVVGPKLDAYRNEWGEIEEVNNERVGSYWKSPWKRNEWRAEHRGESRVFRARRDAKQFAFTGDPGMSRPAPTHESRSPKGNTVRITKRQLKQIIREAKRLITESEVWVDEDGYAHDDEGNKWYVGEEYAGQLMKASDAGRYLPRGRSQGGYGSGRSSYGGYGGSYGRRRRRRY